LPATELRQRFGRDGRLIIAWLVRTILWQLHQAIQARAEPPIGGNVRTLWYRYVKPVMARLDDDRDSYDRVLVQLNRMVFDHRLFNYSGFDLTDLHWETRRIGDRRPDIIVGAEKLSQVRFLREVHALHGVTTLAWSGNPPGVTVENTARHAAEAMAALGRTNRPFRVIALVDYDPEGHSIAAELHRGLTQLGFQATLQLPVGPNALTQKQIAAARLPIIRRNKQNVAQLANWLTKTGGVAGDPYRIRIESIPRPRRHELVAALVAAPSPSN